MAAPVQEPTEPGSAPVPTVVRARGLGQAVAALRHPNYARFWTGALISNCGTWMQNVTVPYVLYRETHSASLVGIAAFAQFFPATFLGPVGGWAADHFPRRKVLLVTQTLMGMLALTLWGLYLAGLATAPVLIGIVFLGGVVAGINIPSWQAFVVELVPRESLLNAVTLNSAQFNAARAVGPAIGGAVLGRFGPSWAFLTNAISYGAVLVALSLIHVELKVANERRDRRVLSQFRESLTYTRQHTGMLLAVSLVSAVAFLVNPFIQLVPVFADDVFHVGPGVYGMLTAVFGIGAVIGAVALGSAGDVQRRGRIIGAGMLAYGGAVILFGASPNVATAAVALGLAGMAFLTVVASLNTSVQLLVPEALRGRVMALYIMFFTAAFPLGSLLQGALADVIGPRPTVVGAGALFVAVAVGVHLRRGLLGNLDGSVRD